MDQLDAFTQLVVHYWHNRVMRYVVPVVTLLVPYLWQTRLGTEKPTLSGVLTAAIVSALCTAFWWSSNSFPRVSSNRIGIVVAISGEDPKHDKQVQADFVGKLTALLQEDAAATAFEVLPLPSYLAARCVDGATANKMLVKARGMLILFGTVRKRKIRGQLGHYLELHGGVRHAPISDTDQKRLGAEFAAALPPTMHFEFDNDALMFEATSVWSEVGARYTLGLAALLSGDMAYAEKLLLSAEARMGPLGKRVPARKDFTNRIGARIVEVYQHWLNMLHLQYFGARRIEPVEIADQVASRLLARDPKHYAALVWKSIAAIVLREDVAAAKKFTERCRHMHDATWRFNRAFLSAYEGNLAAAHVEYMRAFAGTYRPDVPVQTEEFINLILERHPEKGQLYFALGLINLHAKGDLLGARLAFQAFIDHSAAVNFPVEVAAARVELKRLDGDTPPPESESAA